MSNHKDRRFKKFSRAFLLLFCWVVVPLVTVEVAMIFLEPYLFKGFYQYDPDIGFQNRCQVGAVHIIRTYREVNLCVLRGKANVSQPPID